MSRRFDDISRPVPGPPFISRIICAIICLSVMLGAAAMMVR
jgi:hypothetical protein